MPKKKIRKPAKKKSAAKQVGKSRKTTIVLGTPAIDPKRRQYLENRAAGQSKMDAALNAEYSGSMARNAKEKIEKPIQEQLAKAIQARIPIGKIVQRIDEGMDALETKIVQHQGIVTDYIDLVAWSERREYTAMAAEYGQYHIPRQKHEHEGEINSDVKVVVEFLGGSDVEVKEPVRDAQQDQR